MSVTEVSQRIAMLESRFAGMRGGRGRGGGPVGSGIEQALAAAERAQRSTPSSPRAAAGGAAVPAPGAGSPAADPSGTAVPPSSLPPPIQPGQTPAWAAALPERGRAWAGAIASAADAHGMDQRLLAALVWTESNFAPDAVSPAGAIGLGQLMPGTAAELGVDPRDPEQNLDGAARYLRRQLDRFGDVRLALAAYNAGPGRVEAAGGVPRIEETVNYVARVTERFTTLGG